MDTYSVGLVKGFLMAKDANEAIMQAFNGIVHPNYKPVCKSEKPAIAAKEEPAPSPAAEKSAWSRWTHEEVDIIMDTARQERAVGKKTGEIIKILQAKFPERKYNAIYTKMMALGLINEVETAKAAKAKPVKKSREDKDQGEA